jgi:membrane-associated phospholipid phosphatase
VSTTAVNDALLRHRRPLALLAATLVALSAVCIAIAKTTDLLPGTAGLEPWITRPALPDAVRWPVEALIWLARPAVAAAITCALALAAAVRMGPRFGLLVLLAAAAGPLTSAIKEAGRVTSLPSGHAAYAISVFGAAAWLALRDGRPALAAVAAVPAVLMGPARVIEGAHWPADVACGAALGLAWLLAVLLACLPWAAR